MTSNQIAYKQAQEQARSNKANESIKKEGLKEQRRSNRTREGIEIGKTVSSLAKVIGAANDPSWYNLDKQLIKDVASVAYGQPLGSLVRSYTTQGNVTKFPGIMSIHFIPTIGITGKTDTTPINVAAKNIYGFVRYANSGARNYEAVDLMLYLLAIDSAITQLQFAKTLYSVALTAKGENWFYGKAMLSQLLGGNSAGAEDILNNLSQFRTAINTFAVQLNSFYVPNTMPIYQRHAWIVSNIFKDHAVKKSQTYHFVPEVYYTYDDINGKLVPHFTPYASLGDNPTVANIVAMFNSIITAFTTSEDIGIMSGDILKAYGNDGVFFFDSITEDYHIEATYSPEVLSQINAATLVGSCDDGSIEDFSVDIYQDGLGNILMGNATTKTNVITIPNLTNPEQSTTFQYNPLCINMYKDDVSPDDTMVATRLMAYISSGTGGTRTVTICGTELCLYATMQYFNSGSSEATADTTQLYWGMSYPLNSSSTSAAFFRTAQSLKDYSKFDWAPRISFALQVALTTPAITGHAFIYDSMDVANFAIISESDLAAMHGVAILSEFGVPLLGKAVRTR